MKYDFENIINYIQDYDTGVPPTTIICVLFLECAIVLILFYTKMNYSIFVKQTSFCLLMGYIFLVLCITIIFREETFEKLYNLRPLSSYTILYDNLLAQIIMNVMMFIPIGFFAGGALKKKNLWHLSSLSVTNQALLQSES